MEKNQEEETRESTETEALCARLLREELIQKPGNRETAKERYKW